MEIRVPPLGESISEATVSRWLKKEGESVQMDEPIVELETDKITIEVNAPAAGALTSLKVAEGETVQVGALLSILKEGAQGAPAAPQPTKQVESPPQEAARPVLSPAAHKMASEKGIDPHTIQGTGKGGRIIKEDVLNPVTQRVVEISSQDVLDPIEGAREERVPMSRLRQRIAERLKESQNTAAMLTTFNEVDMSAVMALRNKYKESFEKKHGVKLGFMSFFTKAVIQALKDIPAVNAQIDGTTMVYKQYYNIGVAVGTDQGLVVPVLKDADRLSAAGIEKALATMAKKARDGKLTMDDMSGGTFTISNGGVYGSLLSTPILNPPQAGILGLHKIEERPKVEKGAIVARPMMYVALTYDHRIIDGKEAVTFLVKVKELIEDPERFFLEV